MSPVVHGFDDESSVNGNTTEEAEQDKDLGLDIVVSTISGVLKCRCLRSVSRLLAVHCLFQTGGMIC